MDTHIRRKNNMNMKVRKYVTAIVLALFVLSCQSIKHNKSACCNVEVYYQLKFPLITPSYLILNYSDSIYFMSYMTKGGWYEFGAFHIEEDSIYCYPSLNIWSVKKCDIDTVDIKKNVRKMVKKGEELIERDEMPMELGTFPNVDTIYISDYRDYKKSKCYPRIF